jgi:predicted Fe-Mo cluster-binding NifX family protein
MDAARSEHFGHCDVFTVVELNADAPATIRVVENVPHGSGGCIEPVAILKDAGVTAIVVAGMGARPMQGFAEAGITVYYADNGLVPDVKSAVTRLSGSGLPEMHPTQACQGSGNCHH